MRRLKISIAYVFVYELRQILFQVDVAGSKKIYIFHPVLILRKNGHSPHSVAQRFNYFCQQNKYVFATEITADGQLTFLSEKLPTHGL